MSQAAEALVGVYLAASCSWEGLCVGRLQEESEAAAKAATQPCRTLPKKKSLKLSFFIGVLQVSGSLWQHHSYLVGRGRLQANWVCWCTS